MTTLAQRCIKVCRRILLAAVAVTGASAYAQAGTPWWCACHGKSKRFIASSHICEQELAARSAKKVTQCTTAEFMAWNRKACRQEGCKMRPW